MKATPFDDLVHRVNNLLGTIELQVELARDGDSLAARDAALAHILESARRTHDEVRRLQQLVAGAPRPS